MSSAGLALPRVRDLLLDALVEHQFHERLMYIVFVDGGTAWYPSRLEEYLNLWFADHEKARKARDEEGGYLLPYKKHFFVCPPGAIRSIGLDPVDPDWERVGWDCARPRDEDLSAALREAGQVRGGAVAIELDPVGILR